MNRATVLAEGTDVLLAACGEMVRPAKEAAELLQKERLPDDGIIDGPSGCFVPHHGRFPLIGNPNGRHVSGVHSGLTGTSKEVFDYYGLNAAGIAKAAKELLQ